MPQVRFAPAALQDLNRLREFLRPKSLSAAQRAAATIIKTIQLLDQHPQIGRLVEDMAPEFRELVIDFGDSGYVALYRISVDGVTVLAVRHQREVGY